MWRRNKPEYPIAAGLSLLMLLFALLLPAGSRAQQWAKDRLQSSPRHGEYVTIHEPSGRNLQAWVVYPEVRGKVPVVVMIHEIFGLSDWAREMADEVAARGYIVVEPDLLSGLGPVSSASSVLDMIRRMPDGEEKTLLLQVYSHGPSGMGCDPMACAPDQTPPLQRTSGRVSSEAAYQPVMQNMPQANAGAAYMQANPGGTAAFPDQSAVVKAVSALPDPQVMADLDAAADYGKHLPAASSKLYVAGFCWGGGKSFLFATHRRDLAAAFVFYGPPPPVDLMKYINAPVYGFYAEMDARITSTVPQTQTEMKAAGKQYEPVIYPGAGHGFMRAGEAPDASAANAEARRQAFDRLVHLLSAAR